MRSALVLTLAGAVVIATGACKAPTKHTGKRPITSRRESDLGPQKTLEERLLEREENLGIVANREGEAIATEDQFIGVGANHRFHEPDCSELADVPRVDQVIFVSVFDALDGGYHPCATCTPGR